MQLILDVSVRAIKSREDSCRGGGGVTLQHHAGYHGAGRVEKAWPRGSDSRGQNPPKEARESDLWFPNVTDAGDGSLILGLKQAQG